MCSRIYLIEREPLKRGIYILILWPEVDVEEPQEVNGRGVVGGFQDIGVGWQRVAQGQDMERLISEQERGINNHHNYSCVLILEWKIFVEEVRGRGNTFDHDSIERMLFIKPKDLDGWRISNIGLRRVHRQLLSILTKEECEVLYRIWRGEQPGDQGALEVLRRVGFVCQKDGGGWRLAEEMEYVWDDASADDGDRIRINEAVNSRIDDLFRMLLLLVGALIVWRINHFVYRDIVWVIGVFLAIILPFVYFYNNKNNITFIQIWVEPFIWWINESGGFQTKSSLFKAINVVVWPFVYMLIISCREREIFKCIVMLAEKLVKIKINTLDIHSIASVIGSVIAPPLITLVPLYLGYYGKGIERLKALLKAINQRYQSIRRYNPPRKCKWHDEIHIVESYQRVLSRKQAIAVKKQNEEGICVYRRSCT